MGRDSRFTSPQRTGSGPRPMWGGVALYILRGQVPVCDGIISFVTALGDGRAVPSKEISLL